MTPPRSTGASVWGQMHGGICSVYNFDFVIGDNGFLGAVAVTVGAGAPFGSGIR